MLKKQKRHAFTLLEMAIVLFIISLLVLIICQILAHSVNMQPRFMKMP